MRMFIVLLGLCLMTFCAGVEAGPFGGQPKEVIKKVVPDVYDISIHLKGGEVVKIDKVGFSEWGLRKRLTINSATKVLTVVPEGKEEVRRIPTADIEKIEMVPVRKPDVEVKPAPDGENVPAPKS